MNKPKTLFTLTMTLAQSIDDPAKSEIVIIQSAHSLTECFAVSGRQRYAQLLSALRYIKQEAWRALHQHEQGGQVVSNPVPFDPRDHVQQLIRAATKYLYSAPGSPDTCDPIIDREKLTASIVAALRQAHEL